MEMSYGDAVAQLADPHACFKMVTSRRHFAMPPTYLGNISVGIGERLTSELNKYSDSLKGFPMAYNKRSIKYIGDRAEVQGDKDAAIHLRIQVEFIIFQPTVGCVLKGTVNQIAKSHTGCIMPSSFDTCIARSQTTLTAWDGSALKLGQEFLFEVTSIESQNGLLFMRGELGMEIEPPGKRGVKRSVSDMQETSNCDSPKREANDDSVKKKKKKKHHKKDKDSFSDNSAQTALTNSQTSIGDTSNPRGSLSNMDTGGSLIPVAGPGESQLDSNITKKKKKKKKKKKEKKSNEESSFTECFFGLRNSSSGRTRSCSFWYRWHESKEKR